MNSVRLTNNSLNTQFDIKRNAKYIMGKNMKNNMLNNMNMKTKNKGNSLPIEFMPKLQKRSKQYEIFINISRWPFTR